MPLIGSSRFRISLIAIVLLVCGMVFSACHKPTGRYPILGDHFIYGRLGGFTTPDAHANYFLVNNGQLRKDATQRMQAPPPGLDQFDFNTRCPEDQYNSVADLPHSIPTELKALNNTTIGTELPDAGYADIRARIDGVEYKWRIEAGLDSVSGPIREFYNRCNISFR
ncbi:hypothetical protein GCM10023093_24940 [Nemorincola caseinilytica]|uniref:Lipoprotein n=1 Tax=Nemorincola caseinilytica TaxID=2054315 RepID=A0ABP8NMT7_9BACT